MNETLQAAAELAERLGKPTQRNRIGLWLAARRYWEDAANVAAQLNIDAVDIAAAFVQRLPDGARYSGLNGSQIVRLLDEVASSSGYSACALVYNLDLLLAGVDFAESEEVWRSLWQSFPYRRRALLLMIPDRAVELLPSPSKLATWRKEGRLAGDSVESR